MMVASKRCLPVGGTVCLVATIFPYRKVLFADAPSSEAPEEPIWAVDPG